MSKGFDAGLVTVLSGVGVARPRLPQPPTFPAIRYQRIYTTRQSAVDGTATGAVECGVQIDCIANTLDAATTLADSVRGVLNRRTGTWGSLKCLFVSLDTENYFYEQDGDDVRHWVSQRYKVWTNDS